MMRVIVTKEAEAAYLAKGYLPSAVDPEDLVGKIWQSLSEDDRAPLVMLEIEDEKHAPLSRPPVKYMLHERGQVTVGEFYARRLEVLEADEYSSMVADASVDSGPFVAGNHALLDSARAVAHENADYIRARAALLRRTADACEAFLKAHEVP